MTELSFHNDNHHQSLLVPYYKKVYDSNRKLITKITLKMVEKTNKHIKEILHNDDILLKNVVCKIKGRYSDGCCYDYDGIYKYNHKKVPVLYLKIRKN